MVITVIIFLATVIALILMVMFKPRLYIGSFSVESFWVISLMGAILLILSLKVSLFEVYEGLTSSSGMNPIKLLIIFISMSGLSIILDELGFFKQVSEFVLRKALNSQVRIFIYIYVTVSVLTIFTSNDIVILTFTPIIIYFSKHAKINPIPLLISEFVAANTWSLMFIIGNPTNIFLASAFDIGFVAYFKVMFIPTLVTGVFTFILLFVVFRKDLKKPVAKQDIPNTVVGNKFLIGVSLTHLILCTIFLVISAYIHIEMYLIASFFLLSNSALLVLYQTRKLQSHPAYFLNTIKRMPWNLIPFVVSMFIMVIGLNKYGVTTYISQGLSYLDPIYGYGISSFLSANIINNIPMSVLYADIISHTQVLIDDNMTKAIYSTIIGSNIGAYLSPIGALAGMMWMRMIKKEHIDLSFGKFIFYGGMIAVPAMLVALFVLQYFI
ncbi:MAG: SLC13 family permease [Acholeplasma sp.]